MTGLDRMNPYYAAIVLYVIFFIMYLLAFLNSDATPLNVVFLGVVIVLLICVAMIFSFNAWSHLATFLVLQLGIFIYFSMWAALVSDSHDDEQTTLFAFGAILGLVFIFLFSFIMKKVGGGSEFSATAISALSSAPPRRKSENEIKSSTMLTSPGNNAKDEDMADF